MKKNDSLINLSFHVNDKVGGNFDHPSWEMVLEKLESVRAATWGGVGCEYVGDDGPSLSVRAERGEYIVTLLEFQNGEDDVRTFLDLSLPRGTKVSHGGDLWDARMICRDFDFVVEVFKEFFDTGTVSKEKLL